MSRIRVKSTALLAALFTIFGVGLVAAPTASAQDGVSSRIVNLTSNATITGQFRTSWGTWSNISIPPGQWQGEGNGNKAYEPRYILVPASRCIVWHFKISGRPAGTNNTNCAPRTGRVLVSVYFGDGWKTANYDANVTRYYAY